MQRIITIPASQIPNLSDQLIEFAKEYTYAAVLGGNSDICYFPDQLTGKYKLVAGFANAPLSGKAIACYEELSLISEENANWYLGYLTYDIKNSIENLYSLHADEMGWPPLLLFLPELLFLQEDENLSIYSDKNDISYQHIVAKLIAFKLNKKNPPNLALIPQMPKPAYLQQVKKIQNHIARGDIYEVNFCQEFKGKQKIDPYDYYKFMRRNSPAPFAAFLKCDDRFLLSASPERFIKKSGSLIISQPIKGTSPRGINPSQDNDNKAYLKNSLKEIAENIMIVDLVRNDLSKIAKKGTVTVENLCSIFTYPHVHQMISTISAQIPSLNFLEIIKATFPMGSMTGAPKISAMKMIEEFEIMKRGLYSGTVGYISPGMDFDFNVVIRSLQYNASINCLSYMTGSAITMLSDPEKEYEECLLKAYAIGTNLKPVFYDK
jgi:para-aminobenzoate synthetase component I